MDVMSKYVGCGFVLDIVAVSKYKTPLWLRLLIGMQDACGEQTRYHIHTWNKYGIICGCINRMLHADWDSDIDRARLKLHKYLIGRLKDRNNQLRSIGDIQVTEVTFSRRVSTGFWIALVSRTRWIIPDDCSLNKMFHSLEVAVKLSINAWTIGRESALQVDILSYAVPNHVSDGVDGFLKADVPFNHEAN